MKKVCFVLVLLLTVFLFCSCGGYVNSYAATFLITSCHGDEADMKFDTFDGSYHFKVKRDGFAENTLEYEAELAKGEMHVFIGIGGEKELLFTVKGGESRKETIALAPKYADEKTVHLILETTDRCVDGDFEFEYN